MMGPVVFTGWRMTIRPASPHTRWRGARAGMVTGEGLASDCKLMRGQPGSGLSRVVVGLSNVALFGV